MAQLSSTTETICDGGFRIDIQPDGLAVTADKSAWVVRKKSRKSQVLYGVFVVLVAWWVVSDVFSMISQDGPASLAFLAALIGLGVLIVYAQGCKNLRCNRESLEVVTVARGRITSTASYPRESIQKIRFGAVSYSRYGAICGLIFDAGGKKVKVLRGLESPEARRILAELRRLGFVIVEDVAMPMMAEMAMERRSSWLSR